MNYFNQESKRLFFRALTQDDVNPWLDFFNGNDRLHYLGIDRQKSDVVLAQEWIDKQLGRYKNEGLGLLAVIEKESEQLIGMGGLIPREIEGKTYLEVAYSLKPHAWGKGYGTEIAKHMKQFGRDNNLSKYFISVIHVDNKESIHVAKKNGFVELFQTVYLEMPCSIYGDIELKK